jgi:SAM-dependent methyltransferase
LTARALVGDDERAMLRDDGERFLPWLADPVISYEHLHRYRAARDLAAGRAVLDLAAGEGYGSALLAEVAASVVGLDLDPAAALHAAKTYARPGLRFVQGSITELPFGRSVFDLVVCFEALEHVEAQDGVCAEAARVLRPDGLFVVSTPNRPVYTEATGQRNPFHRRELDLPEFAALLGRHFAHARFFGQHVYPVSAVFRLGEPVREAREYPIAREPGEPAFRWVGPERKAPRYVLGVASTAELSRSVGDSFLVDASEQLFEVRRRAEGQVAELARHLAAREAQVVAIEQELAAHAAHIRTLEGQLAARHAHAEALDRQVQALGWRIAAMEQTRAWRLHLRVQALRARLRRLLGRAPA